MGEAVIDGMLAAGVRRLVLMSVYHPQLEFLVNREPTTFGDYLDRCLSVPPQ